MILSALVIAVLYAAGAYLLMQRSLTRIVVGLLMLGHGANLLLLFGGAGGDQPPLVGSAPPETFADPLPQALALTAIVISFGSTAILLALAYASWTVTRSDEVRDDLEDRRIAQRDETRVEDVTPSVEAMEAAGRELPGGVPE